MKSTVSIVRCDDYTPSKVLKAVKEAVDLLGGMEKFVHPGQNVLLKPNLLSAKTPESAVCTHPAVIEAIVGLAAAVGGTCSIGDSPCINGETPEKFARLIEITGMGEVSHKTGASILRFDDSGAEKSVPDAKVFRRILLADALSMTDVLINVPKFKTHDLTQITCAMKNLFGCVPGRRKVEFHFQAGKNPVMFAQILVDILRAVRPQLHVLDGIVGMDGNGPAGGRRRNFGVILASEDAVALDATACRLAGIDPMSIPMIRLASEQGVGIADSSAIETVGISMDDVRIDDFLLPDHEGLTGKVPLPVYRVLRNQLITSPYFVRRNCSACGACVETCPVNAISGEGNRLKIDYAACIRCYCCREVCPSNAVELRRGRLRAPIEAAIQARNALKRLIRRQKCD